MMNNMRLCPALAFCAVAVFLSACSQQPQKPQDYELSVHTLPQQQRAEQPDADGQYALTLASLEQGQHHPAIAALFAKAEQARLQQRWHMALKYLDQARQIQPRNPAVLYRQAWVNLQLGRAAQAEQLLQRAKVFSSGDEALERRLDWLLADALDAQGKSSGAQAARQRATR